MIQWSCCCLLTEFCIGKESGFYAHPSDCTAYYVCHKDTERTSLEYCDNGQFWNQKNKVCDLQQNVDCSAGSEDGSNGDTGKLKIQTWM